MTTETALDPRQAARYLSISLSKLQRLSHAGEIPCRNVNPGGKHAVFRYSPSALDKWLAGEYDERPRKRQLRPSRA